MMTTLLRRLPKATSSFRWWASSRVARNVLDNLCFYFFVGSRTRQLTRAMLWSTRRHRLLRTMSSCQRRKLRSAQSSLGWCLCPRRWANQERIIGILIKTLSRSRNVSPQSMECQKNTSRIVASASSFHQRTACKAEPTTSRSEERRVGKECTWKCRSRWSPYH